MEEKEMVEIVNQDGSVEKVEVITYLISEDGLRSYIVYSKGEVQGVDEDVVVYISRILNEDGILKLVEIVEDAEWNDVQRLLKRIANAA